MSLLEEDLPAVAEAAHTVLRAAKAAGVYITGGGIESQRASIVAPDGTVTIGTVTDGTVTAGPYPETKAVLGGFVILDVPTREAALDWAGRFAAAWRCAQEVRELMHDPEA